MLGILCVGSARDVLHSMSSSDPAQHLAGMPARLWRTCCQLPMRHTCEARVHVLPSVGNILAQQLQTDSGADAKTC